MTSRIKGGLSLGLLAHVDAGKTTLSEAMLYTAGQLRSLGRVDHGSAFLDTFQLERARGITIFSKQARLTLGDRILTLLDTPGHVDFGAETERAMLAMDCAVLVISGTDGIQAHTETLWTLLRKNHVPTFLFVNKMDLPGPGRQDLMEELHRTLSDNCVDFTTAEKQILEAAAMGSDEAMEEYLESDTLSGDTMRQLVAGEKLFPCFFGSALHLDGIDTFMEGLSILAPRKIWNPDFGALVYKISRDSQGNRLTHVKLTGGNLRVRSTLAYEAKGIPYNEKIKEIRLYSGEKYSQAEEIQAGDIACLVGLTATFPGQGLGCQPAPGTPYLEPVMTYNLILPQGADPMAVLPKLRLLEEEDPQLQIAWNSRQRTLSARLMGQVQIEILVSLIKERFDLDIGVGPGEILYKETISGPCEGVGHYEPLRHYAEVHLLLEPLPQGSGLVFGTDCSEDLLDRNWQRLILTHLLEKTHVGVLTGSPIWDMKITLISGRAHQKHTEGGDFRQATYRAVRQGLMMAESILLEPYYHYRLTVPQSNLGKVLGDLQAHTLDMEQSTAGELAIISGRAPVSLLRDYSQQVAAYTRGRGRLTLESGGYAPCKNQAEVVASLNYDPESDLENTPDSVFCAHGAGFPVKWNEVPNAMHIPSVLKIVSPKSVPKPIRSDAASDRELEAIMDREFGPIRRPQYQMPKATFSALDSAPPAPTDPQAYLFVDGYNMIFGWDSLKELAKFDLEAARLHLMEKLCNYAAFRHRDVVLVFDGYRVKGNRGERFLYHNLLVVYTKENETGDMYIESLIHAVGRHNRVWVASSDNLIQLSVFRSGVLRLSARELENEVIETEKQMENYIQNLGREQHRKEREADKEHWEKLLNRLGPVPDHLDT